MSAGRHECHRGDKVKKKLSHKEAPEAQEAKEAYYSLSVSCFFCASLWLQEPT
jgi:hypothetical protein